MKPETRIQLLEEALVVAYEVITDTGTVKGKTELRDYYLGCLEEQVEEILQRRPHLRYKEVPSTPVTPSVTKER